LHFRSEIFECFISFWAAKVPRDQGLFGNCISKVKYLSVLFLFELPSSCQAIFYWFIIANYLKVVLAEMNSSSFLVQLPLYRLIFLRWCAGALRWCAGALVLADAAAVAVLAAPLPALVLAHLMDTLHVEGRPRMEKLHCKRHELVDCQLFSIAR